VNGQGFAGVDSTCKARFVLIDTHVNRSYVSLQWFTGKLQGFDGLDGKQGGI